MVYRAAFTLIEVMVAVMIVSLVIGAMFQLRGNTNHLFMKMQQREAKSDYMTFVLWNKEYGYNSEDVTLYRLLEDFDVESELRRELKSQKVHLDYTKKGILELERIKLELGTTLFKTDGFQTPIERIRAE